MYNRIVRESGIVGAEYQIPDARCRIQDSGWDPEIEKFRL